GPRRRAGRGGPDGRDRAHPTHRRLMPPVPFALGRLLRDGPAPLARRPPSGDRLRLTLVLGPGHASPRDAGLPLDLPARLDADLTILTDDDLDRPPAPRTEVTEEGALRVASGDGEPLGDVDVVLAAGWTAAPAVLVAPGVRARAVLVTADPPPLADVGWTH